MIRLAVMDDHPVVWRAIQSMAQTDEDIVYVGHGERAHELKTLLEAGKPDVMMLDVKLGDDDGLDVLAEAVRIAPDLKILMFTAFGSVALVNRALETGATGFLLKDSDFATIVSAVRHVHLGKSYVDPRLHADGPGQRRGSDRTLTPRETDVLRLIVQGATDRQIADKLVISRHTVKYHTENLKSKLAAHRRTDLVRVANELHLV